MNNVERAYEEIRNEFPNIYTEETEPNPFAPFTLKGINRLSPFPSGCLPERLEKMVTAVSESLQVPNDMVATELLAVVALAVQGKYVISPKLDWQEPLNLYIVVVGKPSERKSPVTREIAGTVYRYEEKENERRNDDIKAYELKKKTLEKEIRNMTEELASIKKKDRRITLEDIEVVQRELDALEPVIPTRLIADDITQEALITLMSNNNGSMSIISSEGGIFDIMAGRYSGGSSNIDVFTKSYSGDALRVDRQNRSPDYIQSPVLTILLTVQPTVINEIMGNDTFKGKGLTARFLYSIPQTMVGKRSYRTKPILPAIKGSYENLIYSLLDIPRPNSPYIIRLSHEADVLSETLFNNIESRLVDDLEEVEDWAGKFVGQVMRIAGVLHCAMHESNAQNYEVEGTTMKNAIEIGYYFLEHSQTAYSIMGLSETPEVKKAKYILKRVEIAIVAKGAKEVEIKKRDLFDLCKGRIKTVEEMEPGLKQLVSHGYISIEKVNTGGRPTEIIHINPEYIEYTEQEREVEL